jgi:type VI secretion system secreted protein Hcp
MALDAYLQLDGIPGEATDDKHQNWIEVLEVQHTIKQTASATTAGTQSKTAARANHDVIKFRKTVDKSSPLLNEKCSSGASIKTAKLEVLRSADKQKVPYLTIDLTDALISHVQLIAAKDGDGEPSEWLYLAYGKINWKYTVTGADGSTKDNVSGSWDLTKSATAS